MIFVVLGTQKFQCNRLLKQVDELIESGEIDEPTFAQVGHSDYRPKYYKYIDFLDKASFDEKVKECSLLITHGGVGTIIAGINYRKPVIVFPRLKKYSEHVDDHQMEIARAFSKKGYVLMCCEEDNLGELIKNSRTFKFGIYVSQREKTVRVIGDYITQIKL
ncbi:PssE/Cps14G family polysaccharide biosynthesis glycosyltransferase [Desulfosporosinus sp. OT]|uniref:PssE/Cps14G family polysaccharide biosynthesis glycosyltransferase n=1 Tax=Desulfosporosinus sp. OT TaxID=913865 RepID=UPI000223A575|nr:PssE/Cps14G family polysaccharide biosynthesis glycosyltransferase [Desulfosporosinus sp. OT]EGW41275.1 glycosyltransferase family 28 C-terminal domain protein [Desulfosporosinus sp. OT]